MTELLRPMPADALLRRPAARPEPPAPAPLVSWREPAHPSLMKPPALAPLPARTALPQPPVLPELPMLPELPVLPAPEPGEPDDPFALLALCPAGDEEDEDDEDGDDCVPTSQMPVPACVPLYEPPKPRRSWRR